jgi:transposase InsO family protein
VPLGRNEWLRGRLHEIARAHPRYGYRRAHALLVREGWELNRKKVLRVWREEGLKVQPRHHKRRRPVHGEQVRRAERPNQVWAIDFQFDATRDGRMVNLANLVDEFTREALAGRVARSCTASDLIAVLDDLVATRGAPDHLRCDNRPELIAWALRDWCRTSGTTTSYIEPGSPWENPFVESYNARMRDEQPRCLAVGVGLGEPRRGLPDPGRARVAGRKTERFIKRGAVVMLGAGSASGGTAAPRTGSGGNVGACAAGPR